MNERDLEKLFREIRSLSENRQLYLKSTVEALIQPITIAPAEHSDIVSPEFGSQFGTLLQAHHGNSARPLTKEHFERALERSARLCGKHAELAKQGNPGHDITIDGVRFSLKTQADKSIKTDTIWISKFMELGKGDWTDKELQLVQLRDQFIRHLQNYERILTLRVFVADDGSKTSWMYELVEIPKALLQLAQKGDLKMMQDSTQMPKPGYCTVRDKAGETLFQLYFDGGTERKLQIRGLLKRLCQVHGTWSFSIVS